METDAAVYIEEAPCEIVCTDYCDNELIINAEVDEFDQSVR